MTADETQAGDEAEAGAEAETPRRLYSLLRKWVRPVHRLRRQEPPIATTASPPAQVPEYLAAAINAASVIVRDRADDETGLARVVVGVHGLGEWHWDGHRDAAARIMRHYPELSETAARRAARLLSAVVAAGQRRGAVPYPRTGRGASWVWDWES